MNSLLSKSLSFLAISFGLLFLYGIYYVGVVSPNNIRITEENRVKNLNQCYETARQDLVLNWNLLCNKLGREDDCLLTNQQYDNFQTRLVSNRINCQNLYGK